MDLDKFITEISNLGLPVDPVLKFLRTVYAATEIPYEREIKTDQRPYPTEKIFEVENWIVRLLQRYELLIKGTSDTTRYGKIANVRYYRLTRKGFELGSKVFLDHLKSVYDDLIGLLESFPLGLLLAVALSATRPHIEDLYPIEIDVKGDDFETVLGRTLINFEIMVLGPGELRAIYEKSKRSLGDLSLVFEKLRERGTEIYEPRIYDIFMSYVLLGYDGKVHATAVQLMEKLMELGLSVRVPRFSSEGEYVGDSWRAPPEVAQLLLNYSSNVDLSEARRLFLAADILARVLTRGLSKQELLEALSKINVSEEEVRTSLEILYEEGVTSRYNEAGEPGSPAFLILDEEKAREEIKKILDILEGTLLS